MNRTSWRCLRNVPFESRRCWPEDIHHGIRCAVDAWTKSGIRPIEHPRGGSPRYDGRFVSETLRTAEVTSHESRKNSILDCLEIQYDYDPINRVSTAQGLGVDGTVMCVVKNRINQGGTCSSNCQPVSALLRREYEGEDAPSSDP